MILNNIENLGKLLHEEGDLCSFWCDENALEKIIYQLEETNTLKRILVVKNWTIWQLNVNDKFISELDLKGFKPQVIYSTYIVWDRFDSCSVGTCVRSTLLVNFYENCLFETKNTIYVLSGAGTKKTVELNHALSIFF